MSAEVGAAGFQRPEVDKKRKLSGGGGHLWGNSEASSFPSFLFSWEAGGAFAVSQEKAAPMLIAKKKKREKIDLTQNTKKMLSR